MRRVHPRLPDGRLRRGVSPCIPAGHRRQGPAPAGRPAGPACGLSDAPDAGGRFRLGPARRAAAHLAQHPRRQPGGHGPPRRPRDLAGAAGDADPRYASHEPAGPALAAVMDHGESVSWTNESSRDSVALRLVLGRTAEPSYPTPLGPGFPVFRLREPRESQAGAGVAPAGDLPGRSQGVRRGRSHRPRGDDRHRGARPYRRAFTMSSRASFARFWPDETVRLRRIRGCRAEVVRLSRFRPAHIGRCRISAKVQIPLNFMVVSRSALAARRRGPATTPCNGAGPAASLPIP